MATYLYCLASDGDPGSAGVRGIDGAPVRALAVPGCLGAVAWVSDAPPGRFDATVERARSHEAVCVAALADGVTPLPMRFGQLFPDDGACIAALGRHAESLAARLARVAGCVELRIVLAAQGEPLAEAGAAPGESPGGAPGAAAPVGAGAGRAYLERVAVRARQEAKARKWCAAVERAAAAELAAAGVPLRGATGCTPGRSGTAVIAHLVERSSVPRYLEVAGGVVRGSGGGCTVHGPYPPYSFAE